MLLMWAPCCGSPPSPRNGGAGLHRSVGESLQVSISSRTFTWRCGRFGNLVCSRRKCPEAAETAVVL